MQDFHLLQSLQTRSGAHLASDVYPIGRLHLKRDGTRAETIFRVSAKRRSPIKTAGDVSSVDCWQPRCAHQR